MILRLSDDLARGLVVSVAILMALGLSFLSTRAAFARYGADGQAEKGLQFAVRLEPQNPTYWYQLGRYQQYNIVGSDPAAAEASFKKALELNPLYTDAWLDLATAYELDGRVKKAQAAYVEAKKSYPTSADVSWRYGNFLLRQGDQIRSYTEMRRAVEADPHRAAEAFSRAYRSNPNIEQILQQLLPAQPNVYTAVISEAAGSGQLAVAQTVWNHLIALRPRLEIWDVEHLSAALLEARDFTAARRVWDEGVATMDLPPLLAAPGSIVWDPSFESNLNGFAFSWRYASIVQGVSVALDRSEKVSGIQSLRLSFDGKHNPGVDLACTLGIVQPGTAYHFSGWIKIKDITTENGVLFRVRSLDEPTLPMFSTHEFHGGLPWTLVEGSWSAGKQTHRISVCVSREASENPEVRISGTTWVDDLTLVPQPLEPRKR